MKLKIFGLIIVALALAACNAVENQSTSGTKLQIVSLTDDAGSPSVFSNVVTNSSDNGKAVIMALPLDPFLTFSTPYMDVLIDQIDVEFKRTDGRNEEGVNVPYHFTQLMSMLVPINSNLEIPFVLIRQLAKQQAPLLALRKTSTQGVVLQLVAVVTIHGKDQGGHRVAPVTGKINVYCSNIAN